MDDSAFNRLAARRGPTDTEAVVEMIEQLDYAKQLITQSQTRTLRIAMIILDHLAEVILHHHTETLIAQGDDLLHAHNRPYTRSERQDIRHSFDAKLKAAVEHRGQSFEAPQALTAQNASILSIAHYYRNAIYHRDTHNPGLLPQLARLQFVEVVETFAASFARNVSSYGERAREFRARLGALGFSIGGDDDSFTHWEVAEACATQLVSGLQVTGPDIKAVLSIDVADRLALRNDVIRALQREGLPLEEVILLLRAAEARQSHGQDPELLRLGNALAAHWSHAVSSDEPLSDRFPERHVELSRQYDERRDYLVRHFQPVIFDDGEHSLQDLNRRFDQATETQEILEAYRDLDDHLGMVEACLSTVVSEVHRLIQEEIDRRLGK